MRHGLSEPTNPIYTGWSVETQLRGHGRRPSQGVLCPFLSRVPVRPPRSIMRGRSL